MQVVLYFDCLQIFTCNFPKREVNQTPYLLSRFPLILTSKYHTLHTSAHITVNWMAPKSDPKWRETRHVWPMATSSLSLHPFRAITFTISHFWVHTRIILLLVECTNRGHSPFSLFFLTGHCSLASWVPLDSISSSLFEIYCYHEDFFVLLTITSVDIMYCNFAHSLYYI